MLVNSISTSTPPGMAYQPRAPGTVHNGGGHLTAHSSVSSPFQWLLYFCWLNRYKPMPNSCFFAMRSNHFQKLINWAFLLLLLFFFYVIWTNFLPSPNLTFFICQIGVRVAIPAVLCRIKWNYVPEALNPGSRMWQTFNRSLLCLSIRHQFNGVLLPL